jgi:hypothetical protein
LGLKNAGFRYNGGIGPPFVFFAVAPLAGRVVVPPPYRLKGSQNSGCPVEPPKGENTPDPSVGVDWSGQRGWPGWHRIPQGIPSAE